MSLAMNKDSYLQALDEFNPTIILADHCLPQLNSEEAFVIARQRIQDIPFIMVTGLVSQEHIVDMIKMGVDDYIIKDSIARLPDSIVIAIQKRKNEKEKRQTEFLLLISNLRAIIEYTSEGLLLLDRDAIVMAFNSKAAKYTLFEIVKEFQIGQSIYDIIEVSQKEYFLGIITKALNGESTEYDRSYDMKNDHSAWINFSVTPVTEAGNVKGICITGRDITEKKIIEQEREHDRSNLMALINNSNDPMWSVDRNLKLITSNKAFDKMVNAISGKTVTKGSDIFELGFSKEKLNRFQKYCERAFSGESFTEIEHPALRDDSWSEISFYSIYNGFTIIGAACISRDITRRQKVKK